MRKNMVIGYVLNENGFYKDKHYFNGTAENMARFIMQFQENCCVITDRNDELILSSTYGFLDKVVNQESLKELQKEIIPYQLDQKKLIPIKFFESEPGVKLEAEHQKHLMSVN